MRISAILLALVSAGALAFAAKEEETPGSVGSLPGLGLLTGEPSGQSETTAKDSGGVIAAVSQFFNMSLPRGIRNNNPGNIRVSSSPWQGKTDGPDTAFETFETPEDGIRAAGKILVNYQKIYGINTLAGLISRYAPSSENNTAAYVAAVSRATGIGANTPFNVGAALPKLLPAIIKHENGVQPYTAAQIAAAIARI